MLNPNAQLSPNVFQADIEKAPTRDGFGHGAVELGKENKNVVVLCADLAESTRAEWFQKEFPDRFIEMGVAEQNMATVAAGMAAVGKIPFITSYAAFNPGRNYEQIRTTIALNQMPVKVCGMHGGVSVGPDGGTHQMLEDIGMMRMLPNMTVIAPADAEEARKAVIAAGRLEGPVYLRFGRAPVPTFTIAATTFEIGKALTLFEPENPQIAIMTTGSLAYDALMAAKELSEEGVQALVLHVPTIKPLDIEAVVKAAEKTGRVITVEEHQRAGGFGSAVAECLAVAHPVPMQFIGMPDEFGQSGTPEELLAHYGLDAVHIKQAAHDLLKAWPAK